MSEITEILENNQKLLNKKFIEICQNGDLTSLIEIYNKYYVKPNKLQNKLKKKFFSFLNIYQPLLPPPVLDLHAVTSLALKEATLHNQENIIHFLLTDKSFVKHLSHNEAQKIYALSAILNSALNNGNVKLTNFILPLIKNKNQLFYKNIKSGFEHACKMCYLDVIKCLFKDESINHQKLEIFEDEFNSSSALNLIVNGFTIACNQGNLELIKFFTDPSQLSSPININKYKHRFYVTSFDILEYFVFELNLDKEEYLKKITFYPDINAVKNENEKGLYLFEKRELYREINNELDTTPNHSIQSKKMKL
jgi:hypothetical protein